MSPCGIPTDLPSHQDPLLLTVNREPHLLAGEAHAVGGCAHIGSCVPGSWLDNDQGTIPAHIVVTPGSQGVGFLGQNHGDNIRAHTRSQDTSDGHLWLPLKVTGSAYLGPSDGGGGNTRGHAGEGGWYSFLGDVVGGSRMDPRWHFYKQTHF